MSLFISVLFGVLFGLLGAFVSKKVEAAVDRRFLGKKVAVAHITYPTLAWLFTSNIIILIGFFLVKLVSHDWSPLYVLLALSIDFVVFIFPATRWSVVDVAQAIKKNLEEETPGDSKLTITLSAPMTIFESMSLCLVWQTVFGPHSPPVQERFLEIDRTTVWCSGERADLEKIAEVLRNRSWSSNVFLKNRIDPEVMGYIKGIGKHTKGTFEGHIKALLDKVISIDVTPL